MRVLIDECVDPRVKTLLLDHQPATVHDQGWSAFEDGALLAAAENEFDVLVTIDRSFSFNRILPASGLECWSCAFPKINFGIIG